MFFLMCYCAVNACVLIQDVLKEPNWRPCAPSASPTSHCTLHQLPRGGRAPLPTSRNAPVAARRRRCVPSLCRRAVVASCYCTTRLPPTPIVEPRRADVEVGRLPSRVRGRRFKYYHSITSLIGLSLCLFIMFYTGEAAASGEHEWHVW